ncbi:MAG: transcription termination factor NusA, partial [Pseudomonadota bacterium]
MIDPGLVVEAMEESLARAAKSRYGAEMDIRVSIDRKNGKATFTRVRTVVEEEELENYQAEFTVEQAKQYLDDPKVGDTFVEEVPPVDMGRIAAQSAKQVILQKVREAERERQYEEFKDRAGTIINGLVKREEYGNVIIDIGRGEAVLRRNEKIGRESYRPNDRIRVFIKDVRREPRGPQIFLSRTAPEFMAELFKMEVPEVYEGIIDIKAVARDPGSRAKIAVISYDNSIDPVGACVGMRGSRVQAVVSELQGEKIDIIPWSHDPATFVVNAWAPAAVTMVVLDEDTGTIEVIVPDDQQSLAIGRRGQNV